MTKESIELSKLLIAIVTVIPSGFVSIGIAMISHNFSKERQLQKEQRDKDEKIKADEKIENTKKFDLLFSKLDSFSSKFDNKFDEMDRMIHGLKEGSLKNININTEKLSELKIILGSYNSRINNLEEKLSDSVYADLKKIIGNYDLRMKFIEKQIDDFAKKKEIERREEGKE